MHAAMRTAGVPQGTEDEVIHISCGKRLAALCPAAVEPLWAVGHGHQDLELCAAYLPTLTGFIETLQRDPHCA